MSDKYQPVKLPETSEEALAKAEIREQFAAEARNLDRYGTATEFELTALLLRAYAKEINREKRITAAWYDGFGAGESSVEVDWEMVFDVHLDLDVSGPLNAVKKIKEKYEVNK